MGFACFLCAKCNTMLMDSNHLVCTKKEYIIFTDCNANTSPPQILSNNFKDCVGRIVSCKCNEFLGCQIISAPAGFDDELSMYCIPLNKLQIYQFGVGYVSKLTMLIPKKRVESNEKIIINNPDPSIWSAKLNKMAIPTSFATNENPRKYKKIEPPKATMTASNTSHMSGRKPSIFGSHKPSIFSPPKPKENKLPFPMPEKPIASNDEQISNLNKYRRANPSLNMPSSVKQSISYAELKRTQQPKEAAQSPPNRQILATPVFKSVIDLSSAAQTKFKSFKSTMPKVIDLTGDSPKKDNDVFNSFKSKF